MTTTTDKLKLTAAQRELWTRWIAALESGEYAQTRGRLRRDDGGGGGGSRCGFCCIGVACDIYNPTGWTNDNLVGWEHMGTAGGMRTDGRTAVGLTAELEGDLIRLNDTGKTFPEIAAYLRQLLAESEAV